MNRTAPARAGVRRASRPGLVGLTVVVATLIGILGHLAVSSPVAGPATGTAAPTTGGRSNGAPIPPTSIPPIPIPSDRSGDILRDDRRGQLGAADGIVPAGTSVFNDKVPAVANLDPGLLGALRRAATDAGRDIRFQVNSGWRSPRYQEQLLRQAVAEYGSEEAAARWVATAETSAHVSGDAVDIGPAKTAAWLSRHGARYGLCPIYRNEPWHYERRAGAADHGCPAMYADPTQDPRMPR
jgi:D-alanyl-D-alanine carboxypeptidase